MSFFLLLVGCNDDQKKAVSLNTSAQSSMNQLNKNAKVISEKKTLCELAKHNHSSSHQNLDPIQNIKDKPEEKDQKKDTLVLSFTSYNSDGIPFNLDFFEKDVVKRSKEEGKVTIGIDRSDSNKNIETLEITYHPENQVFSFQGYINKFITIKGDPFGDDIHKFHDITSFQIDQRFDGSEDSCELNSKGLASHIVLEYTCNNGETNFHGSIHILDHLLSINN
ncbi:MAG: hypothetical protein KDD46_02070 [Bdellovibrionales bacterium]|nr:hypothetical protein [Bdellovibrionales bacterium]